jgi:hypothetical protein
MVRDAERTLDFMEVVFAATGLRVSTLEERQD